ncbi:MULTISPECIES: hypothetical protein [Streptomyces]|uniref:C2H2-type domain-containing protein n=1 Tax=Streptomyces albus (strain ATCC 21838 / DSM 41398 / FERM P-419 / JCM 4703 / NBRC 107858) TaxID=1081613 RepID=A0A0B5EPZ5_STRA4|nr:hypothetical protein [Streptomyces sp. SCSIO ZS0520]AJE84813.1 hypothetical protein SLNWT_4437 [Streptomyces albus]AOU79118.1 hypothetical protein SLNHY_4427 [Streptomyces albus]AYN34853.1 hypothetical protein DUI70_4354 [Streptomyces albus]
MSEITGTGPRGAAAPDPSGARSTVHEAYSFACMRCGHGWEQAYEIEHHVDAEGQPYVTYLANGVRVPSPLSRPTCLNCGGHVVRIMRPGRVSSVQSYLMPQQPAEGSGPAGAVPVDYGTARRSGAGDSAPAEKPVRPGAHADEGAGGAHRWQLSDLLHPFQRRRG